MILNANSIAHHVIQIKNGIIKHVNVNVKIIMSAKRLQLNPKNPNISICENSTF